MHNDLDRIELKGLRVNTIIGISPEERRVKQPLEFDITIFADLREPCKSDQLKDTIDYGGVCQLVEDLATREHDFLLERLASRVADAILAISKVLSVQVVVKKLQPPVPNELITSGISIKRSRITQAARGERHEVIIALGSNLGNRAEYLRYALDHLGGVSLQSQVFETKAVGGPSGQGPFLNMAATVNTSLDPYAFHRKCLEIEEMAGRERKIHWGARTLDIDILFYDDISIHSKSLMIPHPRINERGFVLAPLSEIAPQKLPLKWEELVVNSDIKALGDLDEIIRCN